MMPTIDTIRRFHENEEGLFSLVHLFALLLCTLLVLTLFNTAHIVNEKVRLQNTADAVAYSGTVWMARGMNAVTATNHVIGEMTAFLIVHEAIGGPALDLGQSMERATAEEDAELTAAYQAACAAGCPPDTDIYRLVRQFGGVHAQATLLESKKVLKTKLAEVYRKRAAAMARRPEEVPVEEYAQAVTGIDQDLERAVAAEYETLNDLHAVARSLVEKKKELCRKLRKAREYTQEVVERIPRLAQSTAEEIAADAGQEGTLFPMKPELPLVIDPFAEAATLVIDEDDFTEPPVTRDQIVKVTQLARAAFPWVNYHRKPIFDRLGRCLPVCGAGDFYFEFSNGYSKRICDELQTGRYHFRELVKIKLGLYVVKDYPAPDKGYALWTENPPLADELFSIIGLVRREPPLVVASGWGFRQLHQDGMIAYAQAILYNANEQERPNRRIDLTCKRIVPIRQANVGWDTLDWLPGSKQEDPAWDVDANPPSADGIPDENRPFELLGIAIPSEFPQVQVNWRAKLVPGSESRLADVHAASEEVQGARKLPQEFAPVVERMPPRVPLEMRTH